MTKPLPSAPRILTIAQYPLKSPSHGGQVRLRGIADAFAALGFSTQHLGVYPDFSFDPEVRGANDIVISDSEFNDAYFADPLFGDVFITLFTLNRPALMQAFANKIASASPDLIWLEQPFLYPLYKQAAAEMGFSFPIVYSSANREIELKRILGALEDGPGVRDLSLYNAAEQIEQECIGAASAVICINDEEAAALKNAGKTALYLPASSPLDFERHAQHAYLRQKQHDDIAYAAFAASSYWLNVDGFFSVFHEGAGFLPLRHQIWVAGTAGEAIRAHPRYLKRHAVNDSRMKFLGFLPARQLTDFYLSADAVITPIRLGSGSNLKTADALASGRPVVATTKALAGFRSLVGEHLGHGVYEAESPMDFKRLCKAALEGELAAPDPELAHAFRRDAFQARAAQAIAELAS